MRTPLLLLLLAATPLLPWGNRGHRVAVSLSLKTLPPDVRAWYSGREEYLQDHASDPDHWRHDRKEGPRHYLDVEAYGGAGKVPRTLEEAAKVAGGDYYRRGVVPWIIQDRWKDLVEAFKTGDPEKVAFATAILGHYLADLQVPLHTTKDHDGQTTDQKGVHSRWETGLVERYLQEDELEMAPAKADPHILDRPWEWLRDSNALVPQLLQDDRDADRTTPVGARGPTRGPAYWAIFWARQGPVVKQQLQRSAEHLGDAVYSAWVAAGKPLLPTTPGK